MPKVIVSLDEKEDLELDVYKAKNRLKSKEKAIKRIIREFLNVKKGQVTAFIILGIILVASIVGYTIAKNYVFKQPSEVTVPIQVSNINSYIEDCIKKITLDGAELLGSQGGFLDVKDDASFSDPLGSSLRIFPSGTNRVQYWWYITQNNIENSRVPSINSMQNELRDYIKDNWECNLNVFRDQGYNFELSKPNASVEINDNNILVNLDMDGLIKYKNSEFRLNKFFAKVDVSLGRLYDIAKKIYEYENKNYFLEENTIDDMVVYDEIPYSGVDFDCSPRIWTKTNVIEDFKDILELNIPLYSIKGTNFEQRDKYYIQDVGVNDNNVDVSFMYSKDWPFLIDINPDGEVLKGDSFNKGVGKFLTQFLCLNSYHFVYDIKYPVLISLDKNGYIFQFALQTIIDNNQPRKNRIRVDYGYDTKSEICDKKLTEINVNALSYSNGNLVPINKARVLFKCLGSSCEIGETDRTGSLTAKYPQCMNGLISVEKEGLFKSEEIITTTKGQSVSLIMEPIYKLNLNVKLISKDGKIRDMYPNEMAFIELNDVSKGYTISAVYPGEIELIDGSYFVKVYVIANSTKGIKINEQKIESCVDIPKQGIAGFLGGKEKKCYESTVPGFTLDQVMIGGNEFEWKVDREDLDKGKKLTFYAIYDNYPINVEDINKIMENIKENSKNKFFREPEIE